MKTLDKRLDEGQPLQKAVSNHCRSHYNRMTTLNRKIAELLQRPHSYFMTFTISDEHLHKKKQTYKRKIASALKFANATQYIYNEDYGTIRGRLHYHSLVAFDEPLTDYNLLYQIYPYGSINIKPIIIKDDEALKKYITKQTLHASKNSAGSISYSRISK